MPLDLHGIREGCRCGDIFLTMYDGNVKCMSHVGSRNWTRTAEQIEVAASSKINLH